MIVELEHDTTFRPLGRDTIKRSLNGGALNPMWSTRTGKRDPWATAGLHHSSLFLVGFGGEGSGKDVLGRERRAEIVAR